MEGINSKSVNSRKAWDKLYTRLGEEKLIPAPKIPVYSRTTGIFLKIAAAVLILVVTAAVVYMMTNRKAAVEIVSLNTGDESNTFIKTLADGSVIYLAQNSLFSFPEEFKAASRNVELKGEAFFDIMPNPGKPFIIETDMARIEVLGTAFNVKTNKGNGLELFVEHGKVKVTLKKDPSYNEMVTAGEEILCVKNSLVKSKHFATEASLWYKQRMHFKDEKLRDIIRVLNRNFNTTFVLADNEIGNRKLTVTFQNETAGTMTELICTALKLKSQSIDGAIVLSGLKEGSKEN